MRYTFSVVLILLVTWQLKAQKGLLNATSYNETFCPFINIVDNDNYTLIDTIYMVALGEGLTNLETINFAFSTKERHLVYIRPKIDIRTSDLDRMVEIGGIVQYSIVTDTLGLLPSQYAKMKLRYWKVKENEMQFWFPRTCENISLITTNSIKEVQSILVEKGYLEESDITGKLSKQTKQAITFFQEDNDLKVGVLNKETLRKMGLL